MKKENLISIIIIFTILFIFGFKQYLKIKVTNEVNNAITEKNYGGKIIFNTEKNKEYSFVYYVKDVSFNSGSEIKKPFNRVKYRIIKNKLRYINSASYDKEWFREIREKLDSIKKYDDKCTKCIKVRDYNKDYYIKIEDFKTFELLL